jgi:hypothetical protein
MILNYLDESYHIYSECNGWVFSIDTCNKLSIDKNKRFIGYDAIDRAIKYLSTILSCDYRDIHCSDTILIS